MQDFTTKGKPDVNKLPDFVTDTSVISTSFSDAPKKTSQMQF